MSEGQPAGEVRVQGRKLYCAIAAGVLAMLLGALDGTILGTAMPRVVGELGGLDRFSWVVTTYMLAVAVSTPVWGKLGDMYGRKGAFVLAVVTFLVGSVLAGMSQSMAQLIGFRALQGLGGGGLMVGALSVIGTLVPPRQQGRYQGVISAVMGLALVSGPLAGGVIADHLGWRWCFYVNVPVGVLALLMIAWTRLPAQRRSGARVDYAGALLLAGLISSVVLVTTWGGKEYAWGSPVLLGLGLLAVLLLVALLYVERRAAEPMLPLPLLRVPNFALITVVGLLFGCVMTSAVTFLPIFQQVVQGASATSAGLLLLPMLGAMVAVSLVVGQLITKTGRYRVFVIVGAALLTVGAFLVSRMDQGTSPLVSGAFMVVLGVGMGLLTQTTVLVSLQSAEPKDIGVASSTSTLTRTLGGSIGVALSGTLFAGAAAGGASSGGPGAVEGPGASDPAALDRMSDAAREAYQAGAAEGTARVFLLSAVLAAAALVASYFIRETPLRQSNAQPESAEEPATSQGDDATHADRSPRP